MGVQVAVDAFEGPLRCTQAVNGGRRAFDRTPHVCEPHLGLAFDVGCDRRLDLGLVALERLLDRPSNRFGSRSALDTDSARGSVFKARGGRLWACGQRRSHLV